MTERCDGTVAVVTGAGRMRSIGRSAALALARAGCDVVVTGTGRARPDLQEETAVGWRDIDSVAEEIVALGRRAMPVVCDVSDEGQVSALFARVREEFGTAGILVNNAAASRGGDRVPVVDLDAADWDTVIRVNLRGTFLMSREFARSAREARSGGAIVNVSSIGGKLGGPLTAAYSASKAAVQSLTSSMAKELGPDGIRVNAVCPGVTDTARLGDRTAEEWDRYVATTVPLQRMGHPDEVAELILLLAGDRLGWVTGQSWNIDGGQLTVR